MAVTGAAMSGPAETVANVVPTVPRAATSVAPRDKVRIGVVAA
jgi:hypothetical protein